MAIETKVKVGFDGNEVKKGFAGITSMFSGMARSFGKGAAMMAGAVGGKTLIDLGVRLATGTKELADFSGEIEDVAVQTGSTVSEIAMLNRALQLAGANMDAGRALSTLTENIYDATHGGEDLQNAFLKIGMTAAELEGMNPMQQFLKTMEALSNFSGDMGELTNLTKTLLGGKMGMQSIRLFRNEDAMKNMGVDIRVFAQQLEKSASNLGAFGDQMDRLPYLWRSFNLAIARIIGANGEQLKGIIDRLMNMLNAENLSDLLYQLRAEYAKMLEVISNSEFVQGLKDMFKEIGRQIGEGIRESVGIPKWLSQNQSQGSDRSMSQLLNATNETNSILTQIERSNNRYA